MDLLKNLKKILVNFKFLPKKALLNSYSIIKDRGTSIAMIIILALLSGIGNIFFDKYLLSKAFGILNGIENYILGQHNSYSVGYAINLKKYFIIGVTVFFIVYIVCTVIAYGVKTSLFKNRCEFIEIAQTTLISLIPSVIFMFIANVLINISIVVYLFFMIVSVLAFSVYFYQHISNISVNTSEGLCFVCSISFTVLIIILVKLNIGMFKINLF